MKDSESSPEVIEKSEKEISETLQEIQASNLSAGTKKFIIKCIEMAMWLPSVLQQKRISIARLRKLIFGEGYRRRKKIKSNKPDSSDEQAPSGVSGVS